MRAYGKLKRKELFEVKESDSTPIFVFLKTKTLSLFANLDRERENPSLTFDQWNSL